MPLAKVAVSKFLSPRGVGMLTNAAIALLADSMSPPRSCSTFAT
jgi:hypothetical protein